MEIISRTRWGARYARGFTSAPLPAAEVWLHHSVTLAPDLAWIDADRDGVDDDEEQAMRLLEQIGQDRFGGGISYTWLIPPSGRIYDGHGVDRQGAHTGGRNDRARAICFIGNYDTHKPTAAQVRSAAWLLQEGKRRGWLKAARLNGGHRDLKQTACPGQHAYALIDDINRLAAGSPITNEENDMQPNDPFWASAYRGKPGTYGGYLSDEAERSMELVGDVNKIYDNLAAAPNVTIKAVAEAAKAEAAAAKQAANAALSTSTGARQDIADLTAKVGSGEAATLARFNSVEAKLDKLQLGGVDHDLLADKLAERLAQRLAE